MSHDTPYPDVSVDLSNCDQEPIHVPGSIQPHGVLLALSEPDLVIVQASSNADAFLGISCDALLGQALSHFIEPDEMAILSEASRERSYRQRNGVVMTMAGGTFAALLHRSEGLLVLELERSEPSAMSADALIRFTAQARAALRSLQRTSTLAALWSTLVTVLRAITELDRVMVYRFCEQDGSGEVIAEDRRDDLEPYLGLHYPASDIPKQARRLYILNRLRIIPDAEYTPSPIVPVCNPLTGRHLDLSYSVLRSVSPIHCEYLANMGVRASMSISLVKDERLWGLVACHHQSPRHLPHQVRALCELLGDMCSWMLGPRLENEESRLRMGTITVQRHLMANMVAQDDLSLALTTSTPSPLDMVAAGGFAVSHEGAVATLGDTPSREQIGELVSWLSVDMDGPVYASDSLAAAYPPALAFKDRASGLLATAVSKARGLFLMWFRPERVYEVRWGGDPRKPVAVEGERLGPRKSFALWQETVRLRSRPWAAWELDAAADLRTLSGSVVLQKTAQTFRLNIDLSQALHSRDEFLSMASHELKTPIQTLILQLDALESASHDGPVEPTRMERQLAVARRQVVRLEKLVSQLLDVSRISAGRLELERGSMDLAALAREVAERFGDAGVDIQVDASGETTGSWDEFRLDQVLTNLLSNAIQYGHGEPVEIRIRGQGEAVCCSVRDRGIGIAPELHDRLFERFERAVPAVRFAGLGLGLWIVRRIIEQHGGFIEVESSPGEGATFTFTLPRADERQGI